MRASSVRTMSSSRRTPSRWTAAATRFDFILNTIPVSHEIDGYLQLLGRSGRMVIVGALTPMPGFVGFNLIWWNRAVGGSAIGGIPETQEMLDFCAAKEIYPGRRVHPDGPGQ